MRYRTKLLYAAIAMTIITALSFYLTQVFSTSYFKKGVLEGVLSNAFDGSRIEFYVFGSLFVILQLAVAIFVYKKRKQFGIYNKLASNIFWVTVTMCFLAFIFMIVGFVTSQPTSMAEVSWVIFVIFITQTLTLGTFVYKVHKA